MSESRPTREAYYRVLAESISEQTLVVTSLGNASYVWSNVCDRPENFYLEDAMGLALPLALGLAVSQSRKRVVVAEGDGGLMMHLGALITVGSVAPRNLTVLLVNNNIHAASGGQPLTNTDLDLTDLARSAGIEKTLYVGSLETFRAHLPSALTEEGPLRPGPRHRARRAAGKAGVPHEPAHDEATFHGRAGGAALRARHVPHLNSQVPDPGVRHGTPPSVRVAETC